MVRVLMDISVMGMRYRGASTPYAVWVRGAFIPNPITDSIPELPQPVAAYSVEGCRDFPSLKVVATPKPHTGSGFVRFNNWPIPEKWVLFWPVSGMGFPLVGKVGGLDKNVQHW